MASAIIPKSDQLNADDLIAGPITVKITGVTIKPGEQPVSIFFDGDNGKPYKCCKSMARILVSAWGADSKKYVGRSLTLYRDPTVKWAGLEVGGIRISHMSHIDEAMTMALTATKGSRKPFTVRPLKADVAETVDAIIQQIELAQDEATLQELAAKVNGLADADERKRVVAAGKKRLKEVRPPEPKPEPKSEQNGSAVKDLPMNDMSEEPPL